MSIDLRVLDANGAVKGVGATGATGATGTTGASGASVTIEGSAVATSETQAASTAYGDLATAGPAVTLTLTGTVAIVWISGYASRAGTGNTAFIAVEVSGASTVAAADANSGTGPSAVATGDVNLGCMVVLTGLTAGSNTFTLKYKNDGGSTWTFRQRRIAVYAP